MVFVPRLPVQIGFPVPGAHMHPLHYDPKAVMERMKAARRWPRPQAFYDTLDTYLAANWVSSLSEEDVAAVRQYELQNKNRPEVIAALSRRKTELSRRQKYDKLNARDAIQFVQGLGDAELPALLDYERDHKNRKTVLAALQRRVGDGH